MVLIKRADTASHQSREVGTSSSTGFFTAGDVAFPTSRWPRIPPSTYSALARNVAAVTVLLALVVVEASAQVVKDAKVSGGVISVAGTQATPYAPISWEGVEVTTANRRGSFAFTSTVLPLDCVGTLSDGTFTIDVALSGCAGGAAALQATGQMISYASGDDGAIRTGAVLSYIDNGDGTVTDNSTGLTWEKKTDANVNVNYTWEGALAYVAELNAMNGGAGFAGHNDWRMPNIRELLSTVDYSRSNPPINPAFGPTRGVSNFAAYWSSTSFAGYEPAYTAWGVEFADSYQNPIQVLAFGKSSALHVRAVRGGL
jgi:hypothetical protein